MHYLCILREIHESIGGHITLSLSTAQSLVKRALDRKFVEFRYVFSSNKLKLSYPGQVNHIRRKFDLCYFFSFQSTQSEILLQFYTKLNFFFLHCIDVVKEFFFRNLKLLFFCHFAILKLNVIVIVRASLPLAVWPEVKGRKSPPRC